MTTKDLLEETDKIIDEMEKSQFLNYVSPSLQSQLAVQRAFVKLCGLAIKTFVKSRWGD